MHGKTSMSDLPNDLPPGVNLESLKKIVKQDLFSFARIVLGLDYLYGPVHAPLCEFLQVCPKRAMVVLPRGFLKTSVCSKAYPLWRVVNDPEIRILIVSNTEANAKKMISQIKQVIERNEVFKWLFPEIIPDFAHCKWSDLAAEVNRDASIGYQEATFEAAGVGTNIVSRHYDLIIEDDTLSPRKDDVTGEELMPMKEEVDQVIGWHKLATSLLITPKDSEILVVGTRWAYHDLLGNILKEQPEYAFHQRAAEDEDGVAIYPTRFPTDALRQIEADQGSYMYNALYMNRPVAADKKIFQPHWIREFKSSPANLRKFMSVDPAIRQKDGADYNALVVGGLSQTGKLYVLDYVRMRGTPRDVLASIFSLWDAHPELERISIEAISYQESLSYMLRDMMIEQGRFCPIDPIKGRRSNKEDRIFRLQPLAEAGRFYIKEGQRELRNELMEYPYGRYDDLLDATCDLVPYLVSPDGQADAIDLPLDSQDPFCIDTILGQLMSGGTSDLPFDNQLEQSSDSDDSTSWIGV